MSEIASNGKFALSPGVTDHTSLSLLADLAGDGAEEAWSRLASLYTPLLRNWLARYEIQPADADDLVQEVLMFIAGHAGGFVHNGHRGAFRSWLRTVLVHRLRKHWRARTRRPTATGASSFVDLLDQLNDPNSGISRLWDREHDRHVARELLTSIRPGFTATTWEAFERTVLGGERAPDVAHSLGISPNAVCIAKSRVLQELRRAGRGLLDS